MVDETKKKEEEIKRNNFKDYINKGGKLTFKELRKLNSVYKKDYSSLVL